jgi:hypothetical protein
MLLPFIDKDSKLSAICPRYILLYVDNEVYLTQPNITQHLQYCIIAEYDSIPKRNVSMLIDSTYTSFVRNMMSIATKPNIYKDLHSDVVVLVRSSSGLYTPYKDISTQNQSDINSIDHISIIKTKYNITTLDIIFSGYNFRQVLSPPKNINQTPLFIKFKEQFTKMETQYQARLKQQDKEYKYNIDTYKLTVNEMTKAINKHIKRNMNHVTHSHKTPKYIKVSHNFKTK